MAKIRNQDEQRKALNEINSSIRALKEANQFLQVENPTGIYTFSFKDEEGKKYIAEVRMDSKDSIAAIIMNFKTKEKERILKLAEENAIDVDPEDYEIMDFGI